MQHRINQRNLAEEAGVTQATVSRALRADVRISARTRQRVLAAARRLGYLPDAALSRLASLRWGNLPRGGPVMAFVTSYGCALDKTLYGEEMFREGGRAARQLGYELQHFELGDFRHPGQLARILFQRGIRGVLLVKLLERKLEPALRSGFHALVGCDLGKVRPSCSVVMPDYFEGTREAWRRARKSGARRIGAALLREVGAQDFELKWGALRAEADLDREGVLLEPYFFPDWGQAAQRRLLAWVRKVRPEVVLGFSDTVYWWLREAGLSVPSDVGFVSLIKDPHEQYPISGMMLPMGRIAAASVRLLDSHLRNNLTGTEQPSTVLVRQSWLAGVTVSWRKRGRSADDPRARRGGSGPVGAR